MNRADGVVRGRIGRCGSFLPAYRTILRKLYIEATSLQFRLQHGPHNVTELVRFPCYLFKVSIELPRVELSQTFAFLFRINHGHGP